MEERSPAAGGSEIGRRIYGALATATLVVHVGFILFALAGGLLTKDLPALLWLHLPVVVWSALVNLLNWTCPLTPLENAFRRRAGTESYAGGFMYHYVGQLGADPGRARRFDLITGFGILVWNGLLYGGLFLLAR